ncbi:MAG: hypothetical protein CL910_02230 [Deltaproteobacteria bacterium]|jgi:CubicO group peptidase (beta-lactamase class C family)|nr:hypothetical protein [Deltaproteobacteria bacterium]
MRRLRVVALALAFFTAFPLEVHSQPGAATGALEDPAPIPDGGIPAAAPRVSAAEIRIGRAELEAFVDGLVVARMQDHHVAGVTMAIVHHDAVLLAKGWGSADLASDRPVDAATTLFRPGSISKTFTWTAVMQLVEQGKIDLDADIQTYLPQLTIEDPGFEPITIRHLMAHTPGFEESVLGHLFEDRAEEALPILEYLRTHQPARVRGPGVQPSYSNYGAALAGLIVANLSGMAFEDYADRELFGKLGMRHSTFREPLPDRPIAPMPANLEALVSTGYRWEGGRYSPGGFTYISPLGPAGAMSTTASDMSRWMRVHLNEGELDGVRILSPETARKLHTQHYTMHPELPGLAHGFIESRLHGYRAIGHGGGTVHFMSDMQLIPELGFGLFVSTNTSTGGLLTRHLAREVVARFFPRHHAAHEPKAPAGFEARAGRFAGSYLASRRAHTTAEKPLLAAVSMLMVTPGPDGTLSFRSALGDQEFVEVEALVFHEWDGDGVVRFVEEDGKIVGLQTSLPILAFDKVGPLENPVFQGGLLALSMVVFAGAWIGAWLRRRRSPPPSRVERLASGSALAAGLVWIGFGALVTVALLEVGENYRRVLFEFPLPSFRAALTLAWLGAALSGLSAVLLIPVWAQGAWSIPRRLRHTALVAVAIFTTWLLDQMNWIGHHYF